MNKKRETEPVEIWWADGCKWPWRSPTEYWTEGIQSTWGSTQLSTASSWCFLCVGPTGQYTFQRWPLTKNLSSTSAAQLLEHVSTRNAVVSKPARWWQTIVQLHRWYTGCIRAVDGRLLCVRVPFRGPSAGHLRSGRTCKRCTPAVGAATAALTRLSFAAFTFTRLWGRHQSEDSVFSRKSG